MDQETENSEDTEIGIPQETIAQLKSKHGKLVHYEAESGDVFLFRKPSRMVYEEYISKTADDMESFAVRSREYCRRCLVWPIGGGENGDKPNVSAFDSATEVEPAMCSRIAGSISKLAGRDRPDPKIL